MASPAESFEDYLYKRRAVYVDPLSEAARTLSLLDVLVKNDSESAGWFSEPHPVLVSCGSMKDVGAYLNPEDLQRLHVDGLELFDTCTRENSASLYDPKLFQWVPASAKVIGRKFSFSQSLTVSLAAASFAEAETHFSDSNNLEISIKDMETACVDRRTIANLIKGKLLKPTPPELWPRTPSCTPDILRSFRKHKCWVVHEMLFTSGLTVTSKASASAGASLTCHVVAGTPGGKLQFSKSSANSNDITLHDPHIHSKYPGKILFAFKAQVFYFDDTGTYLEMRDDVGPVRPTARGALEAYTSEKERKDISELFLERAPSDVDSDEDEPCAVIGLRSLPIKARPIPRNK